MNETKNKSNCKSVYFISILPIVFYFLYYPYFKELYWFGDDFSLLYELDRIGLSNWLLQPFVENFCPFFKIIWIAVLYIFDFNYSYCLFFLFCIHAFTVALLIKILRSLNSSHTVTTIFALFYCACWIHKNLILFSFHLTASLAFLFFLLSLIFIIKYEDKNSKTYLLMAMLALILSNLSFARGVIFSPALALFFIIYSKSNFRKKIIIALLLLIPAILTYSIMTYLIPNRVSEFLPKDFNTLTSMFKYSASYLFGNPFYRLISIYTNTSNHLWFISLCGAIKLSLIILSIFILRNNKKLLCLLIMFIFIDFSNAALLGAGRFQEGLVSSLAIRYQRISFLSSFLMLSIILFKYRIYLLSLPILLFIAYPWHSQIKNEHHYWQGKDLSILIKQNKFPENKKRKKQLKKILPHLAPIKIMQDMDKKYNLQ